METGTCKKDSEQSCVETGTWKKDSEQNCVETGTGKKDSEQNCVETGTGQKDSGESWLATGLDGQPKFLMILRFFTFFDDFGGVFDDFCIPLAGV